MSAYEIEALVGHLDDTFRMTTVEDVEPALRRAAREAGYFDVEIVSVANVVPGTCIACTDFVAYSNGRAVLVARPALW